MDVPSSELRLPPTPLPQASVPSPRTIGWGAHSPASKGVGDWGVPIPTTEKKPSTLPTLWLKVMGASVERLDWLKATQKVVIYKIYLLKDFAAGVKLPDSPSPRFCLGWFSNFLGFVSSGHIRSVKLLQNMVCNRIPHPPASHFDAENGGGGDVNQREG